MLEELYTRIYGRTDGLDDRIGANPASPVPGDAVAAAPRAEPTPEAVRTQAPRPSSIPAIVPVATPDRVAVVPTPEPSAPVTPPGSIPSIVPIATPESEPTAEPTPDVIPEPEEEVALPTPVEPVPETEVRTPTPDEAAPIAELTDPGATEPDLTPESTAPSIIAAPKPETEEVAAVLPALTVPADEELPKPIADTAKPKPSAADLFPPVVINIPAPERKRFSEKPAPPAPPEITPCTISVSEDNVTLAAGGANVAIIVGLDDDGPIADITAVSNSPDDVIVRREVIEGMETRALFVVRSASGKPGIYQVRFELPCGKKDVVVRVR